MINSRRLEDLLPAVQRRAEKFIAAARADDIDLLGRCITEDIQQVPGVQRTTTCLSVMLG